MTTLGIVTHELGADCAISAPESGSASGYALSLTALGPFAAEGADLVTNIALDSAGRELAFDARTVGVDAVVTRAGMSRELPSFSGHSERRRTSGIDVLLWPSTRACSLATGPYPGGSAGQALGFSPRSGLALLAGEDLSDENNEQSAGPGSTLAFDVDRGTAGVVPRESAMQIPRAFASVTELGTDLLVAGGENPLGASTLDAAASAELFSTSEHAFTTTLPLILRRSRHAAVTLPASGETLLVGGIEPEPDAPDEQRRPLLLFEAVSPSPLGTSISGLGQLLLGRVDPTALVLADGRVFVGGGSSPDDGEPIGLVEVFSADARDRLFYAELRERPARTFAALPGGGVLSVASCNDDEPEDREDCACFTSAGETCDDGPFVEATWMDPDGALEPVALSVEGATATCATPEIPLLAPGSDGSPWLVSPNTDGTRACLWRFEPWPGERTPGDDSDPRRGPRFVPTAFVLEPAPEPGTRLLSLGPDRFAWVAAGGGLAGASLGHRGPLTRDTDLLASAPGEPRPAHLAPDRNPSPEASAVRKGRATFDANLGRLRLEPADAPAPPLTVWIADTTYDDALVALSLVLPPGTNDLGSLLPVLAFGEAPVGDADCAWPSPGASSGSSGQLALTATRRGTEVTLATSGVTATARCRVATGPLAVGVRAGTAATTLAAFAIERQ